MGISYPSRSPVTNENSSMVFILLDRRRTRSRYADNEQNAKRPILHTESFESGFSVTYKTTWLGKTLKPTIESQSHST